jgi:hypothetical protein
MEVKHFMDSDTQQPSDVMINIFVWNFATYVADMVTRNLQSVFSIPGKEFMVGVPPNVKALFSSPDEYWRFVAVLDGKSGYLIFKLIPDDVYDTRAIVDSLGLPVPLIRLNWHIANLVQAEKRIVFREVAWATTRLLFEQTQQRFSYDPNF